MVLVDHNGTSTLFATVIPVKTEQKGGVYRSDDHGATWVEKNSGLDSIVSRLKARNKRLKNTSKFSLMIANSKADPNILYVGSWQGVAKSTDMGETWSQIVPAETKYYRHASGKYVGIPSLSRINLSKTFFGGIDNFMIMRASDSDPNLVMFTDNKDLHISKDGGTTWESGVFDYTDQFVDASVVIPSLPAGSPKNRYTHKMKSRGPQTTVVTDVAKDPFDSNVYYATYMDMGLQISRDGGVSWEHPSNGIPARSHAWSVLVDPTVEGRVWVSALYNGKIYITTNKGETWAKHSIKYNGNAISGKILDLALDPTSSENNRTLYAITDREGVFKSIDGGVNWQKVLNQKGSIVKVDTNNPNIVYAGTDDGLYKSIDSGATWIKQDASTIGKVRSLSISRDNHLYVIGNVPGHSSSWALENFGNL